MTATPQSSHDLARWITGIAMGIGVILFMLYTPKVWMQGLVVVLSVLGLREYFHLTQDSSPAWLKIAGMLLGGAACALFIFWADSADRAAGVVALMILASFLLHLGGKSDVKARISNLVFFFFGLVYLSLLPAYWAWVRELTPWKFWVFLLLAGTFLADTGAYVAGHFFGRRKLAPRVSPGKTVEGLCGGWFLAVAGALAVRSFFWPDYPMGYLLLAATLIAFVGPLGDLSESLIKRGVNIKDSGDLIPGHGGVLDRVDALLFTGPVVYYFAKFFS